MKAFPVLLGRGVYRKPPKKPRRTVAEKLSRRFAEVLKAWAGLVDEQMEGWFYLKHSKGLITNQ